MKIACATPTYPENIDDGLSQIHTLAKEASQQGAEILCFPESYLPGYPLDTTSLNYVDPRKLEQALLTVQKIALQYKIALIIPMDAYWDDKIYNVAYVIDKNGALLGHQAKTQLDPSEDQLWSPGTKRKLFTIDQLHFGISICHEGFRYPETVRWAAKKGAHIVFQPFFAGVNEHGQLLYEWSQSDGPYYEKAQTIRALENTIYIATSNYAFRFPEAASSIIDPNGRCIKYQPYGTSGVICAAIDLEKATGYLANRQKEIFD